MTYEPLRHSEPIAVMTVFGAAILEGPFVQDYTNLKWDFQEYWWGESARFRVAGLEVYVQDCDGDSSWWELRDKRRKRSEQVLAKGGDHSNRPLYHYWKCIVDAERALRTEVARRKSELRAR